MRKKIIAITIMLCMAFGNHMTVIAAPETMPDGTIFDAVYYAETYPDVAAAIGSDSNALYQHYKNFGQAEGRNPVNPKLVTNTDGFDAVYYAQNNPDVVEMVGNDADDLYWHYITYGMGEGRRCSASDNGLSNPEMFPIYTVEYVKNKNLSSYTAGTDSVYGPRLSQRELDEVAEAVTDFMNEMARQKLDVVEKVLVAHNYLARNCSYAASWAKNGANTAWGALIYGEAQCSGYARAMKALCDAMDVNCYYVHSDKNDHQWNMVEINGTWYVVDVQADASSYCYDFFLCGSNFHGQSYDQTKYPICSQKGFDIMLYVENGDMVSNEFFYTAALIRRYYDQL